MRVRSYLALLFTGRKDTIRALQHVLEDLAVETALKQDYGEGSKLIDSKAFDLQFLAGHSPVLIFDLKFISGKCLRLPQANRDNSRYFRRLGISGVGAKRYPVEALEQVQTSRQSNGSYAGSISAGMARSPPPASGFLEAFMEILTLRVATNNQPGSCLLRFGASRSIDVP